VEVTVEVTPSSRHQRAAVVGDGRPAPEHSHEGRDIYGLLAVVLACRPNRVDFTSWTSANGITINGAPVTSNNIMIDGIAHTRRHQRLRQPEHRRDRRGTGRHEWLYGGERPQQWRAGELRDQIGVEPASRDRMVYGEARFVGGQRLCAQAPGQPEAALPRQYLRLQRRRPGGNPRPGRQPEVRREEVLLLRLAGIHRRRAPTPTSTANYPTALERIGDFSQTRLTTTANYGAIQPIIDYKTGQPFPGNIIPADRINPIGQKLLNLLIQPNGYVPPERISIQRQLRIQRDRNTTDHYVPHGRGADQPVAVQLQGARDRKQHRVNEFSPGVGKSNNTASVADSGTVTTVISRGW
jgi:hypothetical protein